MTIWQKRLLKFIARVIGVICLFIILALFLYYNYYFKKDNLIKYIPPEAVVYANFRLNDNLVNDPAFNKIINGLKKDLALPTLDLKMLNHLVNYNGAFAVVPKITDNQLKFDYLLIFDLARNTELPGEYTAYLQQKSWSSKVIDIGALGKRILIISNSAELTDRAKQIASQSQASLVQNLGVVYTLKQLSDNNQAKVYLNVERLTQDVSLINNLSWRLFLMSSIKKNNEQLYLGLNSQSERLIFQTADFVPNDQINLYLAKVPNNFSFSLNLSNYPHQIGEFMEYLPLIDQGLNQQLQTNKQYLEAIYNISFEKDIQPILPPVELMADQQGDWLLALDFAQLPDKAQFVGKFENLVTKYLATKYPVEVQKTLPDKTQITQIVKDTKIQFENDEIANISLRTVKFADLSWSYYLVGDFLILANNKEKIINYADDRLASLNEDKYLNLGREMKGDNNLVIDGAFLAQYLPNVRYINRLSISDNLRFNNGFRLMLE